MPSLHSFLKPTVVGRCVESTDLPRFPNLYSKQGCRWVELRGGGGAISRGGESNRPVLWTNGRSVVPLFVTSDVCFIRGHTLDNRARTWYLFAISKVSRLSSSLFQRCNAPRIARRCNSLRKAVILVACFKRRMACRTLSLSKRHRNPASRCAHFLHRRIIVRAK